MFWFKQCPRCCGDLFIDQDQYGSFVTCIQCGLSKDVTGQQSVLVEVQSGPVPTPVVPQSDSGVTRRLSHGGRHTSRTYNVSKVAR
jgi:hypothetical protein